MTTVTMCMFRRAMTTVTNKCVLRNATVTKCVLHDDTVNKCVDDTS